MQSRTQGPIFAPRPAEIRPWVRRLGKILPEVMTVYWPRPNAEVRAVRIDGNIFPSTERLCLENNWFISLFIYILTFSSGFSLFIRVVLACEVRSLRFWTGSSVNQYSSFHRIPDLGCVCAGVWGGGGVIKNDIMLLFVCLFVSSPERCLLWLHDVWFRELTLAGKIST